MTLTDVVFGAAIIVSTVGWLVLVAAACHLARPVEVHEDRCSLTPCHVRVLPRPFDWQTHPGL